MSPTPKAQRLRDRLSINPDELPPVPAQPAPAATPDPPVVAPPPASEVEQAQEPPETAPQPAVTRPVPRTPGRAGGSRRRSAAPAPAHVSAVDDPNITAGRKDYRSFYIEDAAFARFRAAIYWLARREDAAGEVPENMSAAVETWMEETATDLERRYNDGETFRMPPVAVGAATPPDAHLLFLTHLIRLVRLVRRSGDS